MSLPGKANQLLSYQFYVTLSFLLLPLLGFHLNLFSIHCAINMGKKNTQVHSPLPRYLFQRNPVYKQKQSPNKSLFPRNILSQVVIIVKHVLESISHMTAREVKERNPYIFGGKTNISFSE